MTCLVTLLFLILVSGCGKDVDTFIPDPALDVKGDINRFFDAARSTVSVSAMINIDFPTPVVTDHKSVFILQPGSLDDRDGNLVTGPVEVSILELLTPGEILLSGIPTHSRGLFVNSGGEFRITCTQDGRQLQLRQGMPGRILTDLPAGTTPDPRTELFYDAQDRDPFSGITYAVTWSEADGNPNTWNNVDVTQWAAIAASQQLVTGYGYSCFTDSLGWLQLGAFAQVPESERANVRIILPEGYNSVNAAVFMVFKEPDAVVRLEGSPGSTEFFNNYIPDYKIALPKGVTVKLIVIVEKGRNNYHYAEVESTLLKEHKEYVIPAKTPFEEIVTRITSL